MKDQGTLDPQRLQELLRRNDPARPMTEEEAGLLRASIVRQASRETSSAAAPPRLRWAAVAAACALALAVSLGRNVFGPDGPEPQTPSVPPLAMEAVEPRSESPRPYQIQFKTPGGTRIIWVLTPDPNRERSES